jgi:hypothetical protein
MWWLHARNYESTDDAFIDARSVNVSSQVHTTLFAAPTGRRATGSSSPAIASLMIFEAYCLTHLVPFDHSIE